MINYPPFEEALEVAQRTEDRVAWAMFQSCLASIRKANDGHSQDLFVFLGNRPFRVEVKDESNYATSGNLCIETGQGFDVSHRRSGILTSESTITVHAFLFDCAQYRTQPTRNFLVEWVKSGNVLRKFGDIGNTGWIIPRKVLLSKDWYAEVSLDDIFNSELWNY